MPPIPLDPALPITTCPANWPDVEKLFGVRGEPSRCWCRWFALPGQDWKATAPGTRKEQLKAKFDDGPEPGVLAFRGDEVVGWCGVEPRQCYPRIERSQVLRAAGPAARADTGVWSVSCFVVAPGHRRSGVAAALLSAAVGHAFANGADVVEGYPVDRALRPKAGTADLYQGTVGLFTAAGFTTISKKVPGREVMRRWR
ncbi:GNAT family N-acetyltransferase [Arthrobacter terricola]|uniref:GNAT family N-acetyltransferase n=1 Tax=Arthrobacter terricola TaxID=2547396 RepID=A0A4R5KYA8_9MICC|nr:GNAT family N-acetyltransferase [Arthrobacter terricola]